MILVTHAVAGATLSTLIPAHPVLAFLTGFASHFVLDSVPHWDYHLRSHQRDLVSSLNDDIIIGRDFLRDLFKIGLDLLMALLLVILISRINHNPSLLIISLGAIGGVLPDFLQFAYFKLRWPILTWLQRFHQFTHTNYHWYGRLVLGLTLQVVIILLFILAV